MRTFIKPIIDVMKFGFLHILIIPWMLHSLEVHHLFPKEQVVTASALNIRLDSTGEATVVGHLIEGQKIEILHAGKDWHELAPGQKHYPISPTESSVRNSADRFYISSHYISDRYPMLDRPYLGLISLIHCVCLIVIVVNARWNFLLVLWNQLFAVNTISLGISEFFKVLQRVISRNKKEASITHPETTRP